MQLCSSTSTATKQSNKQFILLYGIHFYFVFAFTLLLHGGLNHLIILSFYCCGWVMSSLLDTIQQHLLSGNLMCLKFLLFMLCFQFGLFWMCSCNDIPSKDLSIAFCVINSLCSSFLVIVLCLNITLLARVLLKRLAHGVLSSFAFECFFIMVLFTNPSARAGYDTRSIFKRSLTGLNCFPSPRLVA